MNKNNLVVETLDGRQFEGKFKISEEFGIRGFFHEASGIFILETAIVTLREANS